MTDKSDLANLKTAGRLVSLKLRKLPIKVDKRVLSLRPNEDGTCQWSVVGAVDPSET